MANLTRELCDQAIADWARVRTDFSLLSKLIPTNYVFEIPQDDIVWMKKNNNFSNFSTEIGLYGNQIILILVPLDSRGGKLTMTDYRYSVLSPLKSDLKLVEIQEYTVINNAVLSNDLRRVDSDSDTYYPVSNMPVMAQDKALNAIEAWRNEGQNWFYYECSEQKGARIFQKFTVPYDNLNPYQPGKTLEKFICSFGLKYSDIYQRMLVTLIFISFYKTESESASALTISNSYDWSQPCPPICK